MCLTNSKNNSGFIISETQCEQFLLLLYSGGPGAADNRIWHMYMPCYTRAHIKLHIVTVCNKYKSDMFNLYENVEVYVCENVAIQQQSYTISKHAIRQVYVSKLSFVSPPQLVKKLWNKSENKLKVGDIKEFKQLLKEFKYECKCNVCTYCIIHRL